jgi:glycosyltransferase involved in cell wall biosynthesis
VRFTVFGGGDAGLLARLRRLPRVHVRGYYRAGSLPELLRHESVDLALLLSIWPESYGLTLDECRAAAVPVLAFDHGAIAERIRAEGGGVLVPPGAGASGVAAALASDTALRDLEVGAASAISSPERAAASMRDVYARGLRPAGPPGTGGSS